MNIQWFGHSFFHITSKNGEAVAIDPFEASVGYPLPEVSASAVLISHHHFDHNNTSLIQGNPVIFDRPGHYKHGDFSITGYSTFHDPEKGKQRGENTLWLMETEELRVIHCGDLGALPDLQKAATWKPVDLLLIPVGEIFTLPVQDAVTLVNTLKPAVTLPMHYKTRLLSFDLNSVEPFISEFSRVKRLGSSSFQITAGNLPVEPEVWVLSIV